MAAVIAPSVRYSSLKTGVKSISKASGGINTENISEFARTGVDMVSLGVLTHSAPWVGFSLVIVEKGITA